MAPLVGASLELMTPSPFDGWLRPRLFVHGDGAAAFSFERNVAGVEGPDEFALPPGIIPLQDANSGRWTQLEELSIVGQGSRSRIQVRRFVWSAGAGIAFRFDVLGRRLRVKPSFEYLRQELDLIGVVHRAVKLQAAGRQRRRPERLPPALADPRGEARATTGSDPGWSSRSTRRASVRSCRAST